MSLGANNSKRSVEHVVPRVDLSLGVTPSPGIIKEAIMTRGQVLDVLSLKDAPELDLARAEHMRKLYEDGDVLAETDPIFIKVKTIVDRLDVPASTDLVVTDNEMFQAYCNPLAKLIVISRGVLQHFSKHLPNFSQDHLAALLSHETEHAVVFDQKKVHETRTADKLMATFDPAEELRADTEGMKRMAKGGYNPKAMIEILRSLGLTAGREGLTHPEIIDRVRYLDLRLVSDEHPLANTTKAFQKWDDEFLEWSSQPSDVYADTDRLLNADVAGIDKMLAEAKTVSEFLMLYKHKHHYRYISLAKAVCDMPESEELFRLMLVNKTM